MVAREKAFDEFAARSERSIQHDPGCFYSFQVLVFHSAVWYLVKYEETLENCKKIQ